MRPTLRPYTRPALTLLGTVQELTQAAKTPSLPGPAGSVAGTGALVIGYLTPA